MAHSPKKHWRCLPPLIHHYYNGWVSSYNQVRYQEEKEQEEKDVGSGSGGGHPPYLLFSSLVLLHYVCLLAFWMVVVVVVVMVMVMVLLGKAGHVISKEGRRRIKFFVNSLYSQNIPLAPPIIKAAPFTTLTPYYSEEVRVEIHPSPLPPPPY